jgi:hypothetical protein
MRVCRKTSGPALKNGFAAARKIAMAVNGASKTSDKTTSNAAFPKFREIGSDVVE